MSTSRITSTSHSEATRRHGDSAAEKLLNKNFVLLWQGQALSQLGSSIFAISIIFWVKHETGSAAILGLLMMLSHAPGLLVAALAGSIADRFSRRNIIILSDLSSGFLMLLLAALWHTNVGPWGVLVSVFAVNIGMSIAASFFTPALAAALPDIVPRVRLERANSLRSVTQQLCFFAGRLIGATLFRALGPWLVTFLNGITFLLSALTEAFIDIPQELPPVVTTWRSLMVSLKAELRQGFGYVWRNQGLKRLILAGAFTNFFTMAIIVLLPFYVEDHLAASIEWYAILISVFGLGIAFGSALAGYTTLHGAVRARALIVLVILESLAAALLGLASDVITAGVIGFAIGAGMGYTNVHFMSIVQHTTPTEMRGRVFGFLETIAHSTIPLGMGFGGLIFDLLDQNIPLLFGACGMTLAVFVALIARNREFRAFLASGECGKAVC